VCEFERHEIARTNTIPLTAVYLAFLQIDIRVMSSRSDFSTIVNDAARVLHGGEGRVSEWEVWQNSPERWNESRSNAR